MPPTDDLSRALAALSIAQIWTAAGLRTVAPKRDGLVESPFRDDNKPSFSVFSQGRAFKDHASGQKGGVWNFALLAWPNLPKRELADRLIEISGVPRTPRAPDGYRPVDPRAAALAAVPAAVRPAVRAAFERKDARVAVERIYAEREAALRPDVKPRRVAPWSGEVAERYLQGVDALAKDSGLLEGIAKDRGWPVRWAEAAMEDERLSFPWLPWCEPGQRGGKRGKAFLVQLPVHDDGTPMDRLRLVPVGYHQRFFMPAKGEQPARKAWVYVPYRPKVVGGGNDFLRHLEKLATAHDDTAGSAMVPALPFVLSDGAASIGAARLVVLTEGQWDAISLAGACGWLAEGNWPAGVAVFGLRGNEGMDTFLAYYGYWLTACKPVAWVMADNDAAGQKWLNKVDDPHPLITPCSLAEKLKIAGCSRVVVSVLKPSAELGKDFNDLWKARRPAPEAMQGWMAKLGLLDAAGRIAA